MERTSIKKTLIILLHYEGYLETAKVLIENGASPSAEDNDGNCVCYYALQCGDSELFELITSKLLIEN